MQRVKNVDYDDDDLYSDEDYGDEADAQGRTAEDIDNFATLTPVVRAELDEANIAATTKDIEDALWHYFWDVGKSVAYLKNARTPRTTAPAQQTKKEKPKSKFDQAAEKSKEKAGELDCFVGFAWRNVSEEDGLFRSDGKGAHNLRPCCRILTDDCFEDRLPMPPTSASDWFKDTPWTGLPSSTVAEMVPIGAQRPSPKLLGGSSKLAKLAEERRKKAAAAQSAGSTPAESGSSLDRLSKPKEAKENVVPVSIPEPKKYPIRRKKSPTPPPREPTPPPEEPKEQLPDLRSGPTAFGQTLSTSLPHSHNVARMALQDLLGSSPESNPFDGPSPDDTVLKAQDKSKGLNKK
jgi:elongation factor 1 alpha-like protein